MFKCTFKHTICMAVKTITVTEEAYEALRQLKEEGESFSKLILRVARGRPRLDKYIGILGGPDAERMKRNIKAFRKRADKDFKRRQRVLSRHLSAH